MILHINIVVMDINVYVKFTLSVGGNDNNIILIHNITNINDIVHICILELILDTDKVTWMVSLSLVC